MYNENIFVASTASMPFVTLGPEAVEAILANANTKIVLRGSSPETVAAEMDAKASQKVGI